VRADDRAGPLLDGGRLDGRGRAGRGRLQELFGPRVGVEQLLDAAAELRVALARLVQVGGAGLGGFLLQGGEEDRFDDVEGINGTRLLVECPGYSATNRAENPHRGPVFSAPTSGPSSASSAYSQVRAKTQ